jgi:hypothetical protein
VAVTGLVTVSVIALVIVPVIVLVTALVMAAVVTGGGALRVTVNGMLCLIWTWSG